MSTNWADLDTELSETTTGTAAAAAVDEHLADERLVDAAPPAAEPPRAEDPDVDVDVDLGVDVDEDLVDEHEPTSEFDLEVREGWLGAALVFAAVSLMGIGLGVFATPLPVVFAGWVVAVLAGLMAFRQLAWGDAR